MSASGFCNLAGSISRMMVTIHLNVQQEELVVKSEGYTFINSNHGCAEFRRFAPGYPGALLPRLFPPCSIHGAGIATWRIL